MENDKPPEEPKLPKDELSPLVPDISKSGNDVGKVGKLKFQPPPKTITKAPGGSKINVSPSKNGLAKTQPLQPPQPEAAKPTEGGKITKSGIENTIGKIHGNVQKQLNNNKFRNGFQMNYPKIQGGLQKQMKKVDKSESSISKDLNKTKKGIKDLKRKPKGPGLLGLLMGGIAPIAFTIIGGLILITLARMALRKWKNTYMPKNDGSTMSIFGIPIPGWSTLKALGLGIWNFITVGLPNYWDRLKFFFGDMKKKLFGKKGILKDGITIKYNLIRIFSAIIIGHTKKAAGWIVAAIGFILNLFLPGAGSALIFISKFVPAIFTFVMNQVMALWAGKAASAEKQAQNMAANQMATGKSKIAHFKGMLLSNAKGIKPFKGQLNAI